MPFTLQTKQAESVRQIRTEAKGRPGSSISFLPRAASRREEKPAHSPASPEHPLRLVTHEHFHTLPESTPIFSLCHVRGL